MIRTSLAVSALFLALCGTASAADNAALKKCMDSANTTADMVNCNAKEAKVQDTRLNKAYKTALAAQEGARKQQLQDVQRLWITYRDANCGFAGS